jgi:hypothetical protein
MAFQLLHSENLASITISTPVLSPAEAEIHVTFQFEGEVTRPELRGRLMGPRSSHTTTVEIAYPFRALAKTEQPSNNVVTGRVVIPEPSFWSPSAPFLYQGPIEVWADGKPLARLQVSHGLRMLQLGASGLRWNARQVRVRGRRVSQASEEQALAWHQAGLNTWLIQADQHASMLCELADRLGFFVLIEPGRDADLAPLAALGEHVSCMGWVVPQALFQEEHSQQRLTELVRLRRQVLGMIGVDPTNQTGIAEASFLLLTHHQLSDWQHIQVPKLVRLREGEETTLEPAEGLLGYVCE